MATTLSLRRRIKTTQNVSKTTRAMQMIAASKLKRAQNTTLAARPYVDKLTQVVQNITRKVEKPHPEYMIKRKHQNGKRLVIAISPDKGLSGALNTNLAKEMLGQGSDKDYFVTVGKKITSTAQTTFGNQVLASFAFGSSTPSYDAVYPVIDIVNKYYLENKVDRVEILSTHFESVFSQIPHLVELLPIVPKEQVDKEASMQSLYLFEPDLESILPDLLNRYISMITYHEYLETYLSQQAAQMIAMQNATNNAKDMIEDLTLEYNKVRQAKITSELLDITGASLQ